MYKGVKMINSDLERLDKEYNEWLKLQEPGTITDEEVKDFVVNGILVNYFLLTPQKV